MRPKTDIPTTLVPSCAMPSTAAVRIASAAAYCFRRVLALGLLVLRGGLAEAQSKVPDMVRRTSEITELGRRREWRESLCLFHDMRQHGVVPNVVACNALISACGKGNQPVCAFEVFQTLKQQGLVPDAISYSALISACEKGKQP